MTADPFSTSRLRRAVLDAWTAHPPRFREDANAEEDNARRYYRDRVVVELAQNAADAAARAGVPGRLALRLARTPAGTTLTALNTGEPLDADGVASLASLRASAKRGAPAVGRFGVGFAAVRSVADEVTVASTTGSVHFSLPATRAALDEVRDAALSAEVARRGESLPLLRLPFAGPRPEDPAAPPDGFDTAVVLTLRDDVAADRVRAELADVGDTLLLALPALAEVEVTVDGVTRTLRDVADRWVVATGAGTLDPDLLADAPVEDRDRPAWSATWAVPRATSGGSDAPRVVHAPTPTEEPCTLPALLVATLPLDPSRRHVAAGPVTDAVVAGAARVWVDLLAACRLDPDGPDPADLLPPGLPAGGLDAALRTAVVAASRDAALLPGADGGRLPATAAVTLPPGTDRALLRALAPWVAGLVDLAPHQRHLVPLLGVRTIELAEVVDGLSATDPAALRRLLDVVPAEPRTLEQLATLPVVLADGRTVRGARGLVLTDGVPVDLLRVLCGWGVRAVHPDVAHPVLERLGAERVDAWGLLRHPAVRERVLAADPDEQADPRDSVGEPWPAPHDRPVDDAAAVAEVVLTLVRLALGAGPAPEVAWWGELLLEADDGDRLPAAGLVLPGSDAARWFDPEVLPPVAEHLRRRWADELVVVGVRSGLRVLTVPEDAVPVDAFADHAGDDEPDGVPGLDALDGWPDYLAELGRLAGADPAGGPAGAPEGSELVVVADLDAVLDDAWPEVLRALRGDAHRALTDPVLLPGGRRAPSYAAWWLRRRGPLGIGRPFRLPGAHPGDHDLLGPVPAVLTGLDDAALRALGGVASTGELDAPGWADALGHLPPVGTEVAPGLAADVWRALTALAALPGSDEHVDPDRLPAWSAGRWTVVAVEDVAVADPLWAQHPAAAPVVVVPADAVDDVAAWLDVDVAADRAPGRVTSAGERRPVPDVVRALVPDAPGTWVEHDDLRVDGEPLDWWVEPATHGTGGADASEGPVVHACTTRGLARALAHGGRWRDRDALERVLVDEEDLAATLLDRAGDP